MVMRDPIAKEIYKKHWDLVKKHAQERSELLDEACKRWAAEEAELYQECLEKTGHKFVVVPDRSRKLNGELREWCEHCGLSK